MPKERFRTAIVTFQPGKVYNRKTGCYHLYFKGQSSTWEAGSDVQEATKKLRITTGYEGTIKYEDKDGNPHGFDSLKTADQTPMNPETTILVCKFNGKEVGRIPATAPNAESYMLELTRQYGQLQVDYEQNQDAWLLSALHGH